MKGSAERDSIGNYVKTAVNTLTDPNLNKRTDKLYYSQNINNNINNNLLQLQKEKKYGVTNSNRNYYYNRQNYGGENVE